MLTFKIGSYGCFVEKRSGRGNKKQWWNQGDRIPIYEYLGLSGHGCRLKHMFRSVAAGYITCINPVDFELGDMEFRVK